MGDDHSLIFDLELEEDIEAELEHFILLVRLGFTDDAREFHRDVLHESDHLFPVFAELVAFYMELNEMSQISTLIHRFESSHRIFTSSDKHEMMYFLKYLVNDADGNRLHSYGMPRDYLALQKSYLQMLGEYTKAGVLRDDSILSTKVQTCEILLYGASRTFINANDFIIQADAQLEIVVDSLKYWEAAQVFSIMTSIVYSMDPLPRMTFMPDVESVFRKLQARIDVASAGNIEALMANLKVKTVFSEIRRFMLNDESTVDPSQEQRLHESISGLRSKLFRLLPKQYTVNVEREPLDRVSELSTGKPLQLPLLKSREPSPPRPLDFGPSEPSEYSDDSSFAVSEDKHFDKDIDPAGNESEDEYLDKDVDPAGSPVGCPFNKFDPIKFGFNPRSKIYDTCGTWSAVTIEDLKKHLIEHHCVAENYNNPEQQESESFWTIVFRFIIGPSKYDDITSNEVYKLDATAQDRLDLRRKFHTGRDTVTYWNQVFDRAFGPEERRRRTISPYYKPLGKT